MSRTPATLHEPEKTHWEKPRRPGRPAASLEMRRVPCSYTLPLLMAEYVRLAAAEQNQTASVFVERSISHYRETLKKR